MAPFNIFEIELSFFNFFLKWSHIHILILDIFPVFENLFKLLLLCLEIILNVLMVSFEPSSVVLSEFSIFVKNHFVFKVFGSLLLECVFEFSFISLKLSSDLGGIFASLVCVISGLLDLAFVVIHCFLYLGVLILESVDLRIQYVLLTNHF
jgi:hypothetical protein